jgi:phosphoglycerate kinase
MSFINTLDSLDLQGKRVLVRADLNVPMQNGKVYDSTRIDRFVPTVREILEKGAIQVIIISHFGRPNGNVVAKYSLEQLVQPLSAALGKKIVFNDTTAPITLLENLRFNPEEEENNDEFARELAHLADVYINDAFSVSHRAHASVEAITRYLPSAPGRLMEAEVKALSNLTENPQHPVLAIVGGSKISTKIGVLENLVKKVDILMPAGGIANTFLLAAPFHIGQSLAEPDQIETVHKIQKEAAAHGCKIILPIDVIVTKDIHAHTTPRTCYIHDLRNEEQIVDIGSKTITHIREAIKSAKTIVWNGPVGVFEVPPFDHGTREIASMIAQSKAYSVAGGGETVAAIVQSGLADQYDYVSTAGGAFLEFIEGKELPGVVPLIKNQVVPR